MVEQLHHLSPLWLRCQKDPTWAAREIERLQAVERRYEIEQMAEIARLYEKADRMMEEMHRAGK